MAYQPISMPRPQVGFQGPSPLAGAGEMLLQARRAQQEQDAQRAELLMRQQESEANRALKQRQMAMAEQDQTAQVQKQRMEVVSQIGQALESGRPDMARQIAANFGINLDEKLGPQHGAGDTLMAPGTTRTVTHEAPPIGPVQPPTTEYVPGDVQAPKPAAKSFAIDGLEFDPEQSRIAAREQAGRNARIQREAFGSLGPEYGDLAASIATGADPKVAAIVSQRYERDTQREAIEAEKVRQRQFSEEQQARALAQSDLNNQRMSTAIASGRGAGIQLKEELGERQEEAGLDSVVGKIFTNLGFKEIQVQNRKFNDMARNLTNKNAASDAVTSGSFVKMAQGGSGVISDADMEAFWNRIGGVTTRTGEWVQKVLNGEISPEKRAIVSQAVNELAARAQFNLNDVKDKVSYRLRNSIYRDRHDDIIGTYFPAERSRIEDARAIDRAKNKTRANRVKGGGRDALDRDLEAE